jgi:hypothetical protein
MIPPELSGDVLTDYLELWMKINVKYLIQHPRTVGIYESGVRYIPEPPGREVWLAIPHVIAAGGSVCHSLACWRAAELWVKGEDAWPRWSRGRQSDGTWLYHVRVFRGAGINRIEDPSLLLGMGKSQPEVAMLGPTHHVPMVAGEIWK